MFKSSISSSSTDSHYTYINYTFQNYAGVKQSIFVNKDLYSKPEIEHDTKYPTCAFFIPASHDMIPDGLTYSNPDKDLRILPEKTTLTSLLNQSNFGQVEVNFFNSDGTTFHGCPRNLLKKALEKLKKLGYEI
jgi:glutamine synthetase